MTVTVHDAHGHRLSMNLSGLIDDVFAEKLFARCPEVETLDVQPDDSRAHVIWQRENDVPRGTQEPTQ